MIFVTGEKVQSFRRVIIFFGLQIMAFDLFAVDDAFDFFIF